MNMGLKSVPNPAKQILFFLQCFLKTESSRKQAWQKKRLKIWEYQV